MYGGAGPRAVEGGRAVEQTGTVEGRAGRDVADLRSQRGDFLLHQRAVVVAQRTRRGLHRQVTHANEDVRNRSEEHTSELQSLMRISYAVFCLKKKKYK